MDARYLLEALLAEQGDHPRRRLHEAIRRTARAVVGRAEPLGDALVMRYRDTASSMTDHHPHVSALPQAHYAAALTRAATLLADADLQCAADRFFAALLVPVSSGGVLYRSRRDTALALVPTRPRDLILNGWLSALVAIHAFAELRDSEEARQLFDANVRTLRRLLPRYDVPDLRLSRYGLSGPLLLRLRFSEGDVRISGLRVAVPGEGEIMVPRRSGSRWVARSYPDDTEAETTPAGVERLRPRARGIRFVAVLSHAAHPRPNRVRFRLRSATPVTVTTTAHIGSYHPLTSATVDRGWIELDIRNLPAGSSDVDIALPYEPIDLFAYPTNFTRGGPREKVNSYHGTHIVRLRELARITDDQAFSMWAERWLQYVREWAQMPLLAGAICRTPEGDIDAT